MKAQDVRYMINSQLEHVEEKKAQLFILLGIPGQAGGHLTTAFKNFIGSLEATIKLVHEVEISIGFVEPDC